MALAPIGLIALSLAALPPPLTHLLRAARLHNHALSISRAQLLEREAAVRQALAALTPTLQASGGYTRNQYDAIISLPASLLGTGTGNNLTSLVIQPYNAWTATVGVNVPIFSAGSLYRRAEAVKAKEAAKADERASDAELLISVARSYYQVVGAQGVAEAAARAVATARDNLKVTEVKLAAGSVNRLSVDRAKVDVARAEQTLASSQQALALAQRALETSTGEHLTDPLPAPQEPELPPQGEAEFTEEADRLRPELAQAEAALAQEELAVNEAKAAFVPTLTGSAQEHFTNAPGFITENAFWTVGATAVWSVDPVGTPAAVRRAQAVVLEQRERLAQVRDSVRDEVHTAWLAVAADRARVAESTSEAESAREALAITQEQFRAGTATSLDLSQAQRDSFSAEATLAQSRADLASELLSLKEAAGEPLLGGSEGGAP